MPVVIAPRDPRWGLLAQTSGNIQQLLANLALQKIGQNFREKELAMQAQLQGLITPERPTEVVTTEGPRGQEAVARPRAGVQSVQIGGQTYYVQPQQLRLIQAGAHQIPVITRGGRIEKMGSALTGKAPTTRQVKRGDKVITEQWDATTGTWTEVGVGPRYKPTTIINMPAAAERERLATGRATLDSLENLRNLYNENYTGPIKGKVGQIKDYLGTNPQAQSEFYAATAAFKNQIIKEITGAQMSEAEASRIMKQVPDVDDAPSRWYAKWHQSVKNLERIQQRRIEIMRKSGLTVPTDFTSTQQRPDDPLGILD